MKKEIKVKVEIYNGVRREVVDIYLTDEDINSIAESKAFDSYECISAEAKEIVTTLSL